MIEIFPFQPLADIRETVGWLTAHTPCWEGEERIPLRDNPRLEIGYTFAIPTDAELKLIAEFSQRNRGLDVQVPRWTTHEFVHHLATGALTLTLPDPSDLTHALQAGDDIILWESSTSYLVAEVQSFSAGILTFTAPILRNLDFFYVVPLLTGKIKEEITLTKESGGRKRAAFSFRVDSIWFPELPALEGGDIFSPKALVSSSFSTFFKQDTEILASSVGVSEEIPTEGLLREQWGASFTTVGRSELRDMRRHVSAFWGKAKALTFPYELLSRIKAPTSVPPLPPQVYLTTDEVTFNYGNRIRLNLALGFLKSVQSAVNAVIYTTPPYPVALREFLGMTFGLTGLNLKVLLKNYTLARETLAMSFTLTVVNLRTLLKSYLLWVPENLSASMNLSSIVLRNLLIAYENPRETVTASLNLSSILLRVLLLFYVRYPREDLNQNFNLTGVTLT